MKLVLCPGEQIEICFEGHQAAVVVEYGDPQSDDGQRSVLLWPEGKDGDAEPEAIYLSSTYRPEQDR